MQKRTWKKPGKGLKDKRNKSQSRMVISRFDGDLFKVVRAASRAKSQSLSYTIYEAVKEKYQPASPF